MRLHRFYKDMTIDSNSAKEGTAINLTDSTSQIRKVFRLSSGDHIVVFDGSGMDYECEITGWTDDGVNLKIHSIRPSLWLPSLDVCLVASVVKKDTFEWIAEKATELGVSRIVPTLAERSEKKSLNYDRLLKIVREASEQSGRGDIPTVDEVIDLTDLLSKIDRNGKSIIACDPTGMASLNQLVGEISREKTATIIFIGPEGGWSPKELSAFNEHNVKICTLGKQILRAETACVSALSLILLR